MAEPVMSNNGNEPDVVLGLDDLTAPRFTPRELALIKSATGRSLTQLLGDEETDDKFMALAWLKLRRQGRSVELESMQDVLIQFAPEIEVDPTTGLPRIISPRFAVTGE